ncbi:MAG: DUF3858 domain-containing protein, partial [Acidobacteriota bacterium]
PGSRRPISLPGLEAGDAIEYVWRRYIPPFAGVPGGMDNRTLFVFQGADRSYVLSRYVVAHDEATPVSACGNTSGLEFSEEREGRMVIRSWTARNMPRLVVEPFVADRLEITPHVRLGMGLTWSIVGDQLRDALVGLLRVDPPLDEMVEQIRHRSGVLRATTADQSQRQAQALHEVVLERVRPGGSSLLVSTPASAAASAGESNRIGVTLALSRELGLPARLVLARPLEQRGRALDCPGPDVFLYALVELALPEGPIYLDLGNADQPFDSLPPRISGSDALFIPIDPSQPVEVGLLAERPVGVLKQQLVSLQLGTDGLVSGRLELTLRGPLAAFTRELLREVPADRLGEVHQNMAGSAFPGARVAAASMSGEQDADSPLGIALDVEGGVWARRTPTGYSLPVTSAPLGLLTQHASLETRRQALLLGAPMAQREIVDLALPDGLEVISMPQPQHLETRFGRYELNLRKQRTRVVIERVVDLPVQRIEPEDYADFREMALAIDEAERREIAVFSAAPAAGPGR